MPDTIGWVQACRVLRTARRLLLRTFISCIWRFISFDCTPLATVAIPVAGLKICSASKSRRRIKCNKEFYRWRLMAKTCLLLLSPPSSLLSRILRQIYRAISRGRRVIKLKKKNHRNPTKLYEKGTLDNISLAMVHCIPRYLHEFQILQICLNQISNSNNHCWC